MLPRLMLLLAVYWRYLAYRVYFQGYGGNSDRAYHGESAWLASRVQPGVAGCAHALPCLPGRWPAHLLY